MPNLISRPVPLCAPHTTPPLSVVGPCPACVAVKEK